MRTKTTLAILAIAVALTAGPVGAGQIEFSLIDDAALAAQGSPFSPEAMRAAAAAPVTASAIASPAPVPAPAAAAQIGIVRRPNLGGGFGGEKLENALFTTSLVAMAALNVADYLSTRQALKYPGLTEGNPLMKPFVKNATVFAAVKAGTTVLSVWGAKKLFKRDRTTAWIVTTVSNFLLSYVVSNNMRLISRMRPR
jgi:Domain of unknown function (DUF5658)